MRIQCPYVECGGVKSDTLSKRIVRRGSFFRKSDSERIPRFQCRKCQRFFSSAHLLPTFLQKRRRLNRPLELLLCSGVSQRRAARILRTNPKTVVRKMRFLAVQARRRHLIFLEEMKTRPLTEIQFDDLETSEHSKCKPLSVALAVDPETRKILSFQVSQMPAKGRLALISRRKYGVRRDERLLGWNTLFASLKSIVTEDARFLSDENPHYPRPLHKHHPKCRHEAVPGVRGCITGQGELKKLGNDPLFALNHTCAMLRANLNRLFRKTWCTTKKREGLIDHLSLYASYHNEVITPPRAA